MSQENVELLLAAYDALGRRDREALDAMAMEHVAPDFEYEAFLTGRAYKGVDGFWEFLDDIQETVDFTPQVQEAVDLDEHVLIVVRMSGRGSQSGVPVAQEAAVLFTFDGSTLRSGKAFASRQEALDAAGLREQGMSQENVEVVRQMLQAFADGGLDAMAEFWDPDIDWRAAEGAIDDVGEMHGQVAVRRYIQDWIDTFDGFSVVVEELRDVGDDRVLAIQRLKGRAKLSGTKTDLRYAVVNTVRDGKVVRGREYLGVEDALEAAGLRE